MTSIERREGRMLKALGWAGTWTLITVVMVFLVIRVIADTGNLTAGTIPPEGEFDRRYALNPTLAYLHIVPGVIYLLGAPFQLTRRIRDRHIGFHRALGRVVITAGVITGVFAIAVGIVMPFGRLVETLATVVFGAYFLVSLTLAYRAIRAKRVRVHRRWMIRAFSIGIGVGLIRVVVGLFQALGVADFESAFGISFWIAFAIMAVVAEAWLKIRPEPA